MREEKLLKLESLKRIIAELGSAAVAFSGGVDSTFLLSVAREVLGSRVVAVTAKSETFPERELFEARSLAETIGVRHIEIDSEELDIPQFIENPKNRCYYCKKELFKKIRLIAEGEGISNIIDGSNVDDLGDYRPGRDAVKELGVISPLVLAELNKSDIRELSKMMGISTWDKPAFACLSSRFPYGTEITRENVRQVGKAEELLKNIGLKVVRVRYHGDVARVELGEDDFAKAVNELRFEVSNALKRAGFLYASVDLDGYRTGSMNESLSNF